MHVRNYAQSRRLSKPVDKREKVGYNKEAVPRGSLREQEAPKKVLKKA